MDNGGNTGGRRQTHCAQSCAAVVCGTLSDGEHPETRRAAEGRQWGADGDTVAANIDRAWELISV